MRKISVNAQAVVRQDRKAGYWSPRWGYWHYSQS